MTDDTIARHQRVREFVEQTYPGYRFVEIVEDASTLYKHKRGSSEYVLADVRARFVVTADSEDEPGRSIQCAVLPLEDGTLHVGQVEHWIGKR